MKVSCKPRQFRYVQRCVWFFAFTCYCEQAYFREAYNITLRLPDAVGVKIGGGSIVPIELCVVAPNQRFTRRLPQELTKGMVEFTSDKPKARLEAIRRGIVGTGAVSICIGHAVSP